MIEMIFPAAMWALTTAGGAAVGVWAAKRHARVQTDAMAEQAPINAMQAPLAAMQSQVAQAQHEATAASEKYGTFVESQIKAYQAERGQLTEVLTELRDSSRAIKDEVVAHRAEETARASKVYDSLSSIASRLATIEVRVENRGSERRGPERST